jgi:DNA-binding XRE family transcriptional regulator
MRPTAGAEAGRKERRRSWSRLFVLCGGAKSSYAVSCGYCGCETEVRACGFCKGEGQVSSEAADRWRTGKAMRDARVKQGRTQQQEAERLGISPIELNELERGRHSSDEPKKLIIVKTDHSRERGANREVKKMSLNRGVAHWPSRTGS